MNSSHYTQWKDKFLGVVTPTAFAGLKYPKRLLLMFDVLAVNLNDFVSAHEHKILDRARGEMDYLFKKGMITTLSGLIASNTPQKETQSAVVSGAGILPSDIAEIVTAKINLDTSAIKITGNKLRIAASILRQKGIDAVFVMHDSEMEFDGNLDIDAKANLETVARITLEQFPFPSDQTPWEAIIDFKRDADATEKFNRLKKWMNDIKDNKTVVELNDELKWMISDYTNHMKLHNMKIDFGILHSIARISAGTLENIFKLNWEKSVNTLFNIKANHISLLEAEKNTPNNAIAYIVKANQKFTPLD